MAEQVEREPRDARGDVFARLASGGGARDQFVDDLAAAACELVELSRPVLGRASQPFPTPLGSLDAIHLATALIWREQESAGTVLATHDAALAVGARASGLPVIGV